MEKKLPNPAEHKYLSRFVATFLPETRNASKLYKVELTKVTALLLSVLDTKLNYKPDVKELLYVFKELKYTFVIDEVTKFNDDRETAYRQIFLSIAPANIERLRHLLRYLQEHKICSANVRELNLQIDIFNKIYPIHTLAA